MNNVVLFLAHSGGFLRCGRAAKEWAMMVPDFYTSDRNEPTPVLYIVALSLS